MISDKDIIIELLRQREDLRDELLVKSAEAFRPSPYMMQGHADPYELEKLKKENAESKECVDELNRIIADLRKENQGLKDLVYEVRNQRDVLKASYEVKQVEKIMADRDALLVERDDLRKENTRIYNDLEAALEERDAWKTRHDDLEKKAIELRTKYDGLNADIKAKNQLYKNAGMPGQPTTLSALTLEASKPMHGYPTQPPSNQ